MHLSLFVFVALQPFWLYFYSPIAGFKPPCFRGSLITHNDAPQLVGLLWTSDKSVAETSTWQHTTLTTNIHAPGGIRTHNLSRRAAEDLRLRPRDHWDRQPDTRISQIYFGIKLYIFRIIPLSIIRSLFTVHSAMVCVIQICRQLSSRTRSCSKAVYKPGWHIPLLSVKRINSWWWTEELSEICRV